jgi:RimJ/RimL family protein N-acetyltransferase
VITERHKASDVFIFAIRPLDSAEILGIVDLNGIEWAHGVCWLSAAVGYQANWDKGYGTEAVGLALGYAFNELNMHRVQVTVFDYNARSMALFEKLGFRREGTYREAIHRDGKRYDMHLYGILRREWDGMSFNSVAL